jgi:hypothetical protein
MAARTSRACDPCEPVASATRRPLGTGTIHPEGVVRDGRVSAWCWRRGRRDGFAAGWLERVTIAVCFGTAAVATAVRGCRGVGAAWFAGVVVER